MRFGSLSWSPPARSHGLRIARNDAQVLHALRASGVPCVHLVFAPGCDGESSAAAMADAVRALDDAGKLLGSMPLNELIVPMSRYAASLSASRTPNLIKAAFERRAQAAPDARFGAELCTIRRHGHEAQVPYSWLTVALALKV